MAGGLSSRLPSIGIAIQSTVSEFFCRDGLQASYLFIAWYYAMFFILEGSPDYVLRCTEWWCVLKQLGATQITVFIADCDVTIAIVLEIDLDCVLASTCLGIKSLENLISCLKWRAIEVLEEVNLIWVKFFVKKLDWDVSIVVFMDEERISLSITPAHTFVFSWVDAVPRVKEDVECIISCLLDSCSCFESIDVSLLIRQCFRLALDSGF